MTTEKDALEKSFNRLTEDSDTAVLLFTVEDKLREKGNTALADRLDKLQRDITAYFGGAEDGKTGGELTKPFIDGYEKLTIPRVAAVMNDIESALKGEELANDFGKLANDVREFLGSAQGPKARPAAASIKPM